MLESEVLNSERVVWLTAAMHTGIGCLGQHTSTYRTSTKLGTTCTGIFPRTSTNAHSYYTYQQCIDSNKVA
eukprot:scaffold481530_cov24-Prasinocladus_malaysianus.AAC.1